MCWWHRDSSPRLGLKPFEKKTMAILNSSFSIFNEILWPPQETMYLEILWFNDKGTLTEAVHGWITVPRCTAKQVAL